MHTVGQGPPPQAPGDHQTGDSEYWTTSPLTRPQPLNRFDDMSSQAQVQCTSLVRALMGYFQNPVDSSLMVFPSRYMYCYNNPIIAGMLPHMIHIATWFALIGPARNFLRAAEPILRVMLTRIARTAMSLIRSSHAVNYADFPPEACKLNLMQIYSQLTYAFFLNKLRTPLFPWLPRKGGL